MALPIDNLPPASLDGIEFPYTTLEISTSLDHHIHKYLHSPGGEIESLGRHVSTFKFSVLAHQVYPRYRDMYPIRLSRLISVCNSERTVELRVPNAGIYKVKATQWTRSITQAKKSGESVELTFTEDNTDDFTVENIVGPAVSSLPTQALLLVDLTSPENAIIPDPLRTKILALQEAVNDIIAQRDDALSDVELARVQVGKAVGLCQDISAAPYFNDPANSIEIRAFHDTWDIIAELAADRLTKRQTLGTYAIFSRPMSIVEVSLDLYGTTEKVPELLQLNLFSNAMMIPVGTLISYYQPTRKAA